MSKDLTEGQNFTLGTIAAFVEGVLLQPTLYWKNARAQKLPFTLNPRLLYRGTAASIFNEMQMMGVQFGLTGWFEKLLPAAKEGEGVSANTFLSAAMGGALSACFSSPIELIMIQQQKHGGSFLGTPVRVVQAHGLLSKGMFRGLTAAMCRDGIYAVGMLGVTPLVQDALVKEGYSLGSASFYASMLGGVLAAVPSHPFDVIKTCMQGDLARLTYCNLRGTARGLLNEGISRCFHGVFWRTVNITATVYIANECRNYLTPTISKWDV